MPLAEERRKRELEEEDEEVNKFFYKVQAPAGTVVPKGKGKARAETESGLLGGYGSDSEDEDDEDEEDVPDNSTITVKRRPAGPLAAEPTVQDLLRAKGIALGAGLPATAAKPKSVLPAGVKRKSGGGSLGIKLVKKAKA
jgi:hypothetical protein